MLHFGITEGKGELVVNVESLKSCIYWLEAMEVAEATELGIPEAIRDAVKRAPGFQDAVLKVFYITVSAS